MACRPDLTVCCSSPMRWPELSAKGSVLQKVLDSLQAPAAPESHHQPESHFLFDNHKHLRPSDADANQRVLPAPLSTSLPPWFIRRLFLQLRSHMKTNTSTRQWSRILVRTRNQTLLRVMSCLQLASKLNFSTQALSPAVVQGFLRQLQQPFSRHSIMASERRVLKTINFQFGEPACTFLQHLVGSLQQLAPRPDPMLLYSAGLAALDLVFLHIHHVFPYQTATISPRHRHTLACDYVRLSAAVVVCGLVVLDDYRDGVGLALHRLTDLPMREVEKLAAVILRTTQVVRSSPSP